MTLLTFAPSLPCSLANNTLRVEGCEAVAAVLGKTQITSLKCACLVSEPCMDFVPLLACALTAYDASHLCPVTAVQPRVLLHW